MPLWGITVSMCVCASVHADLFHHIANCDYENEVEREREQAPHFERQEDEKISVLNMHK